MIAAFSVGLLVGRERAGAVPPSVAIAPKKPRRATARAARPAPPAPAPTAIPTISASAASRHSADRDAGDGGGGSTSGPQRRRAPSPVGRARARTRLSVTAAASSIGGPRAHDAVSGGRMPANRRRASQMRVRRAGRHYPLRADEQRRLGRDPDLQRGRRRSSGSSARRSAELDRVGARRAPDPDRRRQLAGRHRRDRRLARGASSRRSRCSTATAKNGLGHAYLAGFAHALDGGAELVIEMDADFSHDPRYLGDLLEAAEQRRPRARLALRRRRRRPRLGSAAAADQPRRRHLRAHDPPRPRPRPDRRLQVHPPRVLEAIDLASVRAEGYVFQIEVTYRALLAGFKVVEVPIVFSDRTAGTSKMSTRIAVEAMWLVPSLRRTRGRRAALKRRSGERGRVSLPPNVISMLPIPQPTRCPGILAAMSVQSPLGATPQSGALRAQRRQRSGARARAAPSQPLARSGIAARRHARRAGCVISIAAAGTDNAAARVGAARPELAGRPVRQRRRSTSASAACCSC